MPYQGTIQRITDSKYDESKRISIDGQWYGCWVSPLNVNEGDNVEFELGGEKRNRILSIWLAGAPVGRQEPPRPPPQRAPAKTPAKPHGVDREAAVLCATLIKAHYEHAKDPSLEAMTPIATAAAIAAYRAASILSLPASEYCKIAARFDDFDEEMHF